MRSCFIFILNFLLFSRAPCFHIDNIHGAPVDNLLQTRLDVHAFFEKSPPLFKRYKVITNPLFLQQAARDVLQYFTRHEKKHFQAIDPEGFKDFFGINDVKRTLQFIIDLIDEDKESGVFRILDPIFLKHNFFSLAWKADWKNAQKHGIAMPHDGKIRLTSYGILSVKGSYKKTANFPCGIYYLNDRTLSNKYTKHQILGGILERPENIKKRHALAWVSRQSLEDALMQGTILVHFPDGSSKVFNVYLHNGISYNRSLKNVLKQKRYWFFREIRSNSQAKTPIIDRFKMRKGVIFAGDLYHIGIGKLIALTYQHPQTKKSELRLGIIADTGSAFKDNLYQLDLFGGIFNNRELLNAYLKTLPNAAQAYILCKK